MGVPWIHLCPRSRGVQGRRQCPGLVTSPWLLFPREPAGQSWVPTSLAAGVVLWAAAAGVLGRVASAHTSPVPPTAAGTGAASPTSPWPPHTPCGHRPWGQHSRPLNPKKGKPDLALGAGTRMSLPVWPLLILGAVLWHTGIYWEKDVLNEPKHLQRLKHSRTHPRNKRRRLSGAERRAR